MKYYFGLPTCCGEAMDRNDSETHGYPDEYQCRECGETTTRSEYENREQGRAERAHEAQFAAHWGGHGPLSINEQHAKAWQEKQESRR